MKANETRNDGSVIHSVLVACALAAVVGCGDDDTTYDPYDDYYAYGYYYPSDGAYADAAWADPAYGYADFVSATGAPKGKPASDQSASPMLSMSRAESLCPGQVSFTPTMMNAECNADGQPGPIQSGANVVFTGCKLSGGGQLDGSIDVTSTRTFSDTNCNADTTVSVNYRSVSTNLTFTAPSGARVLAPMLTRSGSFTRLLMTPPSAISVSTSGNLERYSKDGTLVAQTTVTGTQSVDIDTDQEEPSYSVSGTLTMQDAINSKKLTVTGSDVTRSAACCRPSSGSITIASSGSSDDAVFKFGPECGDVELNGETVELSECF